jgi:ABC-type multidrug transport system ATPase subunit
VLRCRNLTVRPEGDSALPPILRGATAVFRPRAMNAIIGPSGCGKTMLVKAMLGLVPVDAGGEVWLDNARIARPEDLLGHVAFAPQFSIAQPKLTVEESLRYGLELTLADVAARHDRLEYVLGVIGLAEHRHKRIDTLSGGQLRRLSLGLELLVDPPTLICDEVTSGLDPLAENTILDLLQGLCRQRGKSLLCIIHNLAKLNYFNWITVLNAGDIVFQGKLQELHAYFNIPDALHLYDALNTQPPAIWRERWAKASAAKIPPESGAPAPAPAAFPALPSGVRQFLTLLRRRTRLLFRDYGYLSLVMAITFGFPVMVVIFALDGLPQIAAPPLRPAGIEALKQQIDYTVAAAHTSSLVTSLIMFQVILLTLMGANNGAREIAGERLLYEKERLAGLRPGAYAASKLFFTGLLAALQGVWMTGFVKLMCVFPGPWLTQTVSLALVAVAMTWVCLAFSAWMASAEKASTLSIYLVGFQLPLSGVVLALPVYLVWIIRPFINAYWGWAGYFKSMAQEHLYDAYTATNPGTLIPDSSTAMLILLAHALVGAALVWWGCRRRKWNA